MTTCWNRLAMHDQRPLTVLLFVLLLLPLQGQCRTTAPLGTGGTSGVYYPTGRAIAAIVNNNAHSGNLTVTVESTAGSVYNINGVLSGALAFGIAQSDRQYQAWQGIAEWQRAGAQKKLRAVCSLHPEIITLIASRASGIRTITDLRGKRVNIGNPGSGQLQNAKDVLLASGVRLRDFTPHMEPAADAANLLQTGIIDAFFYTVGHPNAAVRRATTGPVAAILVPITGSPVNMLLRRYPYYAKATIPARFYPALDNGQNIDSIGVKATLVTSSELDSHMVYDLTRAIFTHLAELKKLHPALAALNRQEMLQALSAPIHRGALQYYREAGLISRINPELLRRSQPKRAAAQF